MVSSEDDLIVYLGREEKSYAHKVYPKVSIISRRIEVSPDIDLLKIDPTSKETIGFETKYIRYRKIWKRFDYRSVYEGFGESLLYFDYGIEKVFLVIGYDTASVPEQASGKLMSKIGAVMTSVLYTYLHNVLGLRVIQTYGEVVTDDRIFSDVKSKYYCPVKDWNFRKQCLINEEFSYNQKLYDRIYH